MIFDHPKFNSAHGAMFLHEKIIERLEETRKSSSHYTEDELEMAMTWVICQYCPDKDYF